MSKKFMKLLVGSLILAGSFVMGTTPKQAEASWCPPYYCCDPQCFSIRRCYQAGANCFCEEFCRIEPEW